MHLREHRRRALAILGTHRPPGVRADHRPSPLLGRPRCRLRRLPEFRPDLELATRCIGKQETRSHTRKPLGRQHSQTQPARLRPRRRRIRLRTRPVPCTTSSHRRSPLTAALRHHEVGMALRHHSGMSEPSAPQSALPGGPRWSGPRGSPPRGRGGRSTCRDASCAGVSRVRVGASLRAVRVRSRRRGGVGTVRVRGVGRWGPGLYGSGRPVRVGSGRRAVHGGCIRG